MEALKRRIRLAEEKLNPQPKATFDLVKYIQDIRLESERLMGLSESDYSAELKKPPSSEVNQLARDEVAYEKRFDAMTPEEQQKALGYAGVEPQEYARIMKERAQTFNSPDNWITRLFAERARKLREEQNMTHSR